MFKLILVLVACYISYTDACSCWAPEGWQFNSYYNSDFAGTFKVLGPVYNCGEMKHCYSIAVVQQFRGTPAPAISVLETNNQSAACGVSLAPGHTYFVATNPLNANRIGVYLCGLLVDWTDMTCCDMIAEAKKYASWNGPTPIEIDPVVQ